MKKSSSGNMILYVIITALLVYILFLRNSSGYKSPEKNAAYKAGHDDFKKGERIDDVKLKNKYRRGKNIRYGLINVYKKGWNDAKDLSDKDIKVKKAVTVAGAIKAREDLDKKIKEVKKNMKTTSSSSFFDAIDSTTSSFFDAIDDSTTSSFM